MISKELAAAREYEERESALVREEDRPMYHFSPRVGWLNDPNGFSYYDGKYHLFYQYHPYDSYWGPMHWGHAVSDDMISWEYLPAALAPDQDYDGAGCFSGSLVNMPDGRQLIMYTGCATYGMDPDGKWRQTQNIAVRNGGEFIKYGGNPVIRDEDLPDGGDIYEFRDPYVWINSKGAYRALVANASRSEGEATQLTLYRSDDGFSWERDKVIFEDFLRIGIMWECPNLFKLDDAWVLIASPMDMEAEEADGSVRFPKGSNVCYILGDFDEENEDFVPHQEQGRGYASYHPVDCGLDFYAPHVKIMPDGRCILIGWMQDPKMANLHDKSMRIFGQMTIPRELSVRNGRLYQNPINELKKYRKDKVSFGDVDIGSEPVMLPGIRGRMLDLEIDLCCKECREFVMRFASDDKHWTELKWRPEQSVVTIDRSNTGQAEEITRRRAIRVTDLAQNHSFPEQTPDEPVQVPCCSHEIRLRVLIDRWSAEIFVNDGEEVMSVTYYTDLSAQDISFRADGSMKMDITGYTIAR